MIRPERQLSYEYENRVTEMIGTSACAGCPIMNDMFISPALRIDHAINWSATSYAVRLPKTALTAVIDPNSVVGMRYQDKKELSDDFTRFFGQTPEKFATKAEPPLTAESIDEVASELVRGLPEKSKRAGDRLIKKLEKRLDSCSNEKPNPRVCATDK